MVVGVKGGGGTPVRDVSSRFDKKKKARRPDTHALWKTWLQLRMTSPSPWKASMQMGHGDASSLLAKALASTALRTIARPNRTRGSRWDVFVVRCPKNTSEARSRAIHTDAGRIYWKLFWAERLSQTRRQRIYGEGKAGSVSLGKLPRTLSMKHAGNMFQDLCFIMQAWVTGKLKHNMQTMCDYE